MAYRDNPERDLVPPFMAWSLVTLALVSLMLVAAARLTGRPLDSTPPASPIMIERQIVLVTDLSGTAEVRDVNGQVIAIMPEGEGGFVAGIHRVIQRERTRYRVEDTGPVLLRAHENGRLSITDPATGWSADLMGFGADNAAAFVRLLN